MESGDVQLAVGDTSLGSDGYGCWEHPFRKTKIRMDPVPLRHLSDEALQRIKAKPKSEIGGLLWGRILPGSVLIEDAQLLHSNGSLYNATALDTRDLEQAIERNHPDRLELVGYFRSHIRDGLCLSTQDQCLITKCLRNPAYIFLLIRPFEMGICMGAFFFWQNGQLQTDGSDLEVPFLALNDQPVIENKANVDESKEHKSTAAPEQHQDPVASRPYAKAGVHFAPERRLCELPEQSVLRLGAKTRLRFPAIRVALLIGGFIAAAGSATYFAFPILKAPLLKVFPLFAVNPEVGLKVVRGADGQLDVTWDRKRLERAGARRAALTIIDGPISKQLTIDSVQLRSGTLTYFPSGSDVRFRFEVNLNAGHSTAESMRVVLLQRRADSATFPSGRAVAKHALNSEKRDHPSTRPSIASRAPLKAPVYTPASGLLNSQKGREQPHAPRLQLDPGATSYALRSSPAALPSPPSYLAAPLSAPARIITPVQPAFPKPAFAMTPADESLTAYVPPRPVRQVVPDIQAVDYALASQTGKVEVQVTIDDSGHVTDARPVNMGTKVSDLLANTAVIAARQWIFQPATFHGKTVSAEHRIVFNFRKPVN